MLKKIGNLNVASPDDWKEAREELLVEEKTLMKARDHLAAKRRRLPVTEVHETTGLSAWMARRICSDCLKDGRS